MEITVQNYDYDFLIRESERAEVIRRMVRRNKYVSIEDIKAVLDIEVEPTEGEANV